MQRIMNNPDNIVDEMLKGFLKAHSDIVESTENGRVVKAKDIPEGKVGVVTGGGSGHNRHLLDMLEKICVTLQRSERSALHRQQPHSWMRAK